MAAVLAKADAVQDVRNQVRLRRMHAHVKVLVRPVLETVSIQRIAYLAHERAGPIGIGHTVLDVDLLPIQHRERLVRRTRIQPAETDPRRTRPQREAHTAQRRREKRPNDAVVVRVAIQAVREPNQAAALDRIAVVVNCAKHKHGQKAAASAYDEIEAIQHSQAARQTQKHGRNHGQARQVGHEKHLQNVNVNHGKRDTRHIERNEKEAAPPNVDAAQQQVALNHTDHSRLKRIVRTRRQHTRQHQDQAMHPLGHVQQRTKQSIRAVVVRIRIARVDRRLRVRPVRQRARHANQEHNRKQRQRRQSHTQVQAAVRARRKGPLPKALVEHL